MKLSPREEGYEAFVQGLTKGEAPSNPYPKTSLDGAAWNHGYTDAQYDHTDSAD